LKDLAEFFQSNPPSKVQKLKSLEFEKDDGKDKENKRKRERNIKENKTKK